MEPTTQKKRKIKQTNNFYSEDKRAAMNTKTLQQKLPTGTNKRAEERAENAGSGSETEEDTEDFCVVAPPSPGSGSGFCCGVAAVTPTAPRAKTKRIAIASSSTSRKPVSVSPGSWPAASLRSTVGSCSSSSSFATATTTKTFHRTASAPSTERKGSIVRVGGLPMKRGAFTEAHPSAPPKKVPQTFLPKAAAAQAAAARAWESRRLKAQLTGEAEKERGEAGEGSPADPAERSLARVEWEVLPRAGRVVCFDLETTGLGRADEIVEVGAVELVDGVRTGALFHSYARPQHSIHPTAAATHGLTVEALKDEPPPAFVVASFLDWVGTSALVAHNATFDIRMLTQAVRAAGLEGSFKASGVYCTMRHYRAIFPGSPSTLNDLAAALKVGDRYQRARVLHGALVDAELLAACYQKLICFGTEHSPNGTASGGTTK